MKSSVRSPTSYGQFLDVANARALAFFEAKDGYERRWDANVHAGLTRYFAIALLDRIGLDAHDESSDAPFERVGLANNGICLLRGSNVIRVRKADDGRLPPPGSSAQEQFYAQQMSLPLHLVGLNEPVDPTNFLILWGISPVDRVMNDLVIACPNGSKEPHWYAKVPHPVIGLRRSRQIAPVTTDDDFDEIVPAELSAVSDTE